MNNDSNNCPKKSEGQNWEILLFARWMQGAVNMRYMPCKIPELGRSFPCLSRCILTRSNLTSSMLRRRSSFSTWSVGSLQSSPPPRFLSVRRFIKSQSSPSRSRTKNRATGIQEHDSSGICKTSPSERQTTYTASRFQQENVYHVKSSPNLAGSETKREGLEMYIQWEMA